MTISQWLTDSSRQLHLQQIDSAHLDCLVLLEATLQQSREWTLSHSEEEITPAQLIVLNKMLSQRLEHTPLAYIIGSKEFYGCNFFVNENVLIPRPESEMMIDLLKEVRRQAQDDKTKLATNHQLPTTIVDIGTGSGCLAITAKLEIPNVSVIATDISKEALTVAKKNARIHNADIKFLQSDLLTSVPDLKSSILLANLPYVPSDLITSEEITKEPASALFSGKDGLDHYRKFWKQIASTKNKPTYVFTESLENQHSTLLNLATQSGYSLINNTELIQIFTYSIS